MGQKVTAAELAERNEVPTDLVQCDGCPAGVLVQPGRPGHRSVCEQCSQHCQCFRIPDGIS